MLTFKPLTSAHRLVGAATVAVAWSMNPVWASAQEFQVFDKNVQVHGFTSEAFVKSDKNNLLTMETKAGSGAFTDAGLNMTSKVTKKLRLGGQIYVGNIGALENGRVTVDWALADYQFTPWLGVRGGKVKTTLGLYNDTQDMTFLHTFALLPQSIYSVDMRDTTLAHKGADVYGDISMRRAGRVAYTAYGGWRKDTPDGGYPYLLKQAGIHFDDFGGSQVGADVRWFTPVDGLMGGVSYLRSDIEGTGTSTLLPGGPGAAAPVSTAAGTAASPYREWSNKDATVQYFGQYQRDRLKFDAEYRGYTRDYWVMNGADRVVITVDSWYAAGSYRLSRYVEMGAYFSRFGVNSQLADQVHINDTTASARVDVTSHLYVKVEGHFMRFNLGDGGIVLYPVGVYSTDNPNGIAPTTNLLVVKTGFTF